MKPVVFLLLPESEASQTIQNPDVRFSPNYITHNGKQCYEGYSYIYSEVTSEIVWKSEDKKSRLKEGDIVAFHF